MILVSSCLVGFNCRYNGTSNRIDWIAALVDKGLAMPICPEQLGGLTTPRPAAEIQIDTGAVITVDGNDVSAAFNTGAARVAQIAKALDVHCVILKARSPSCGRDMIYSGNFDGTLITGDGVTARCLKAMGVAVFTEEQREEFEECLNERNN